MGIVGYDFTWSKEYAPDAAEVMKLLNEWCKKWVFQVEKGEATGYDHYQGRVHLHKEDKLGSLIKKTKDIFPKIWWSITSNGVHQANNFTYVMKADTRVAGPWRNDEYVEPPTLTRQLKNFMENELYPWQEQVQTFASEYNERYIHFILDKEGNAGKSIFCEYLEYKGLAFEIPPFKLMEDLMACAMCIGAQKCYIIDMPRAMKKDKLADFYAGIECLKNGTMYDKRYSFKKRRIDRPAIIVFANIPPVAAYMSIDRWSCWELKDKKLHSFTLS